MEYEFNEDVARRLGRFLQNHGIVHYSIETEKHSHSEMTEAGRRNNLNERTAKANKIYNDLLIKYGKGKFICLFISIHANAFSNPAASGYEIFVYKIGNEATKLANKILVAGRNILGVGSTIKDRGIKEANFVVLANTRMPAILIEHEFYTNLEASKKLKDNNFRELCAKHILEGLLNYIKEV